jgi:hypothetical protein
MFSYQLVVLSMSAAYAATSARGRAISISVVTSTGTRSPPGRTITHSIPDEFRKVGCFRDADGI